MTHASLFSGIGMWDYAATQMGWRNLFHCEQNKFCQTILKYYWPESETFEDVITTNFKKYANRIDVLSGSCPCQPFSNAGKRGGTEDNRHLWPSMYRAIREIKPTWVCYENVPGLISIEDGMVFEQVCLDLENEGYEVTPFIIPACATDKDHRRDRVWIVAYSKRNNDIRKERRINDKTKGMEKFIWETNGTTRQSCRTVKRDFERGDVIGYDASNTNCQFMERGVKTNSGEREKPNDQQFFGCNRKRYKSWVEAATRLCVLDDGNAGGLDTTTISKSKWRTESLKAAGNTIIWEIAYNFFVAIEGMTKIN